MAALQKIRSNTWIIAIMGVGLFLFLITMVLDQNTISAITNSNRNVGEVYGEDLHQEEFFQMVNEASEAQKLRTGGTLTDEQSEQVREQVWNEYVTFRLIEHECKKLGITITDAEVQEALREGSAQSFQNLPMFMNQQGRFDYTALQNFFKQYKEMKGKQVDPSITEQFETINRLWAYTEQQLRRELLLTKYQTLLVASLTANPVSAQQEFNDRTQTANAEVAAFPFAAISDKEAPVSDTDVKAVYDEYKELFRLDSEVRNLRYIDVPVQASAADKKALSDEMNVIYDKLQSGNDPAAVINASKSSVRYSGAPLPTSVYPADIQAQLDSMSVGSIKKPYLNLQDNTMNIVKLISKAQQPDSILYRALPVQAADANAVAARTDSILKALNAGARYADIAKKVGVPADSMWITAQQFESTDLTLDNAKFIEALYASAKGAYTTVELGGTKLILQVLDRKSFRDKVVAAVVKVPVNFSKVTYDAAVSKFNRFLAANRTLPEFLKNAAKEGYQVQEQAGFATQNQRIGGGNYGTPGIAGTKDAVRWVFDTASEGDISPLYEVGEANNHLLVVAVEKVIKKGYQPLDSKMVKEFCTAMAKSVKKGEAAAKKFAGVKTLDDAVKKGAVKDQLTNIGFGSYAVVPAVGFPEPLLAAAVAAGKVGQVSAPIIGRNGAYLVRVTARNQGTEKFDAKQETAMLQRRYMQHLNSLLGQLYEKAEVVDHRYKF